MGNLDFVLVIVVLAAAFAALALPLYRAQAQGAALNVSSLDDLLAQRDGIYATLRDLDLDRQLGKLDASDYGVLREKYMARATEILERLDTLRGEGQGQEASAEIEREVAAMRKATKLQPKPIANPTPASSAAKDPSPDLYCTNCGRQYKPGDQFCARCGRALI